LSTGTSSGRREAGCPHRYCHPGESTGNRGFIKLRSACRCGNQAVAIRRIRHRPANRRPRGSPVKPPSGKQRLTGVCGGPADARIESNTFRPGESYNRSFTFPAMNNRFNINLLNRYFRRLVGAICFCHFLVGGIRQNGYKSVDGVCCR
jgi:hypothetical protein